MVLINHAGNPTKTMHLATNHFDSPDLVQASLTANPPPKSKMTPQGSFVSTVFQSIKEGEDSGALFKAWKGQNRYRVGNAKTTKTIKMAGVADPTVTFLPRAVMKVNKSPQPENNIFRNCKL